MQEKVDAFSLLQTAGKECLLFANAVKASFALERHNMGCKLVKEAIFLKLKTFLFPPMYGEFGKSSTYLSFKIVKFNGAFGQVCVWQRTI